MAVNINMRRGIATLEFVFVFPILLAIVAAVIFMARADVEKTAAVTLARNNAWKQRDSANPGNLLSVTNDPMTSRITGAAELRVPKSSPLGPNDYLAKGKTIATGVPWDFNSLVFNSKGQKVLEPHLNVFNSILANIPGGKQIQVVTDFAFKAFANLNPDEFPLNEMAVGGSKVVNAIVRADGKILGGLGATAAVGKLFDAIGGFVKVTKAIIGEQGLLGKITSAIGGNKLQKQIDYMENVISTVQSAFDVGRNLDEASQGKPGAWFADALKQLGQGVKGANTSFPE